MDTDKIKQWISLIGGVLGALYLALQSTGIDVTWLQPERVSAWLDFFTTLIPFVLVGYGLYKNTYLIKGKAKVQEEYLKEKGLK